MTIVLAGCTTMMKSPLTQYIEIVTPDVAAAQCVLKTSAREYNIQTPQKVHVERSLHNIEILCKKEGYLDTAATLTSTRRDTPLMTVLNLMVPGESRDVTTKSVYQYPIRASIKMQAIDQKFIELYEVSEEKPE